MKLTDKYLLREYLFPVFYCLLAFCMIQVIFDLFDHLSDFMDAGVPLKLVASYYLAQLAMTMEYLVPASLLLATLYTLWQFTRHNELTALRAGGLSVFRIVRPFLFVGLFFAVTELVVRETVSPKAARWAEGFKDQKFQTEKTESSYETIHYMDIVSRHEWRIDRFSSDDPTHFFNVTIKRLRNDKSTASILTAREARYLDKQWWLFDTTNQQCNALEHVIDSKTTYLSPLGRQLDTIPVGPNEIADSTVTPFDLTVNQWPEDVMGFLLSSYELRRHIRSLPDTKPKVIARLNTDFHMRMAVPWACLVAVLLGIPAGVGSGRHSALTGILVAIFLFVMFYMLTQVSVLMAKKQVIWPWLGAWLSNIVFMATGLIMMRKMR